METPNTDSASEEIGNVHPSLSSFTETLGSRTQHRFGYGHDATSDGISRESDAGGSDLTMTKNSLQHQFKTDGSKTQNMTIARSQSTSEEAKLSSGFRVSLSSAPQGSPKYPGEFAFLGGSSATSSVSHGRASMSRPSSSSSSSSSLSSRYTSGITSRGAGSSSGGAMRRSGGSFDPSASGGNKRHQSRAVGGTAGSYPGSSPRASPLASPNSVASMQPQHESKYVVRTCVMY